MLGNLQPQPEIKSVEVVTIEKPAPVYHPVLPPEVSFLPVQWRVLTPDVMEEYVTDLKAGEAPTNVYYGLTVKSYENLSSNMSDVKRYLRQILNIVDYYQDLTKNEEKEDGSNNEHSGSSD
tara:strand:+ start:368 stop:730 length:363 start_codon:yes stop_codon:yes gene_type:complete